MENLKLVFSVERTKDGIAITYNNRSKKVYVMKDITKEKVKQVINSYYIEYIKGTN